MSGDWDKCKTKTAGKWKALQMTSRAGITLSSSQKRRSSRATISITRQNLAREAKAGHFVALESKDDEDGFSFWLTRVNCIAFQHAGANKTVEGVKLKKDRWYITVTVYDRFPPSCPTTFKRAGDPWTIDVEGVVANKVVVKSLAPPPAAWQESGGCS